MPDAADYEPIAAERLPSMVSAAQAAPSSAIAAATSIATRKLLTKASTSAC